MPRTRSLLVASRACTVVTLGVLAACAGAARAHQDTPDRSAPAQQEARAKRPNVVLIYGDDVGYGDLGAYGAKKIPTPALDRLAAEGLAFRDGHCTAATCTPSRFSLLTGIHGFRHKVRILAPNAPMKIRPGMRTLPQIFRTAGYASAVIGKWHLGIGDGKTPVDWNKHVGPGPLEVGFDTCFLLPSTNDRVPCVYVRDHKVVGLDPKDPLYVGRKAPAGFSGTVYPDGKTSREAMTYYESTHGHNNSVINGIGRIGYQWGGKSALWDDEGMADVFVREAERYIAARAKQPEQPFFLYFSSQDIHVPRAPHPRFGGKSDLSYRGDAMVQLDWSVGKILAALDAHGMRENTIVIFSSDNGPVYDDGYDDGTTVHTSRKEVDRGHDGSGIYRGGKYQIYEGGTRVPFILRWPGRIKPGWSDALVSQIDFCASFAKLLGVELADTDCMDSRDNLAAFLGEDPVGSKILLEEARQVAIRRGRWKYIPPTKKSRARGARGELYDLDTDPGEKNNILGKHAGEAIALRKVLGECREARRGLRSLSHLR